MSRSFLRSLPAAVALLAASGAAVATEPGATRPVTTPVTAPPVATPVTAPPDSAPPDSAQPAPLTRERVVALVRQSPAARVTRSEAAVYGAAAAAAGGPLENPVLAGMGGVRLNPDGSRPLSAQANLAWPLELGGQQRARSATARAEHRTSLAAAEGSQRLLVLEALLQYQLLLKDERELALAEARHALSQRFHAAAQRRQAAGGVPELDVALAALEQQQDASARAAAQGACDVDRQTLATLLGVPAVTAVDAELVPEGEAPTLAELLAAAAERAEVRAALAELSAVGARAERARAARWPTLNVLAQYERDDGADIGLLGLEIPLPLLNANRVEVATSRAEVDVARAKLAQARARAEGQARGLHARYLATKAALEALLPSEALALRAVSLAARGYELGESDLASVLLVRREALEAQAALLGSQHGHALVKLELLVSAGRPVR